MKWISLALALLTLAGLTACDLFASEAPQAPVAPASTLPRPVGNCQSRLGGSVTNTATKQSPADVTVELASGSKTIKTRTDANGLYGFAGLCAGRYTVSITPPGGKVISNVAQVSLDGSGAAKHDLTFK